MYDHTCMITLNLQITRSDIRPLIKVGCQPSDIHMVTLIFFMGLCGYVWANIFTFSPPRWLIMQDSCTVDLGLITCCSPLMLRTILSSKVQAS